MDRNEAQTCGGETPSAHEAHYFLGSRNAGASKRLCGNVVIVNFLVNDGAGSEFTAGEQEDFRSLVVAALQKLKRAAGAAGVPLTLRYVNYPIEIPERARYQSFDWIRSIPRQFGKKSIEELQRYFEEAYGCDEAPVMMIVDRNARSYAYKTGYANRSEEETSVIFSDQRDRPIDCRARTYLHELLHQFGASDLYYPALIDGTAKRYFPNSIMRGGDEVDELTAYLIGWTDTPSAMARRFLEETLALDESSVRAALKDWLACGDGKNGNNS